MYYKNNVEQFAKEFIDNMFCLGRRVPCWFRRLCILLFPISLPIWLIIIIFSMVSYLVLIAIANLIEAWKCKH